MRAVLASLVLALTTTIAAAENIYIQVAGANYSTRDNTTTFSPQRVTAKVGDIVFFNFTSGNHSATQSTFAAPCQPAHDTNVSVNGFDSGLRDTGHGTAVSILSVPILDSNVNQTMWFFDMFPGACGSGAVGVINNNESSLETLAGFVRNAQRLNGSSAVFPSTSKTASSTASSSSSSDSSSDAQRLFVPESILFAILISVFSSLL